jgi:hypothetical protein
MKPFSPDREVVPQQTRPTIVSYEKRGAIMLALILNAIYRQFLKAALPGMATLGVRR